MRIVVDAGHGGWDLGTVDGAACSKKIWCWRLRSAWATAGEPAGRGSNPHRATTTLHSARRTGWNGESGAGGSVCLRTRNYSDLPFGARVETYYTNFFSARVRRTSRRGRQERQQESGDGRLSAADLHEKIEQSRRLAASVQRSLYGTCQCKIPGLRDRGVKEASYVVLTKLAMPGILAEVSFVSSPTDEQKAAQRRLPRADRGSALQGIAR